MNFLACVFEKIIQYKVIVVKLTIKKKNIQYITNK